MVVYSSSICFNNIIIFVKLVTPHDLWCTTHTACPLHPFGHRTDLFQPTYKVLPFAIFQKSWVGSGIYQLLSTTSPIASTFNCLLLALCYNVCQATIFWTGASTPCFPQKYLLLLSQLPWRSDDRMAFSTPYKPCSLCVIWSSFYSIPSWISLSINTHLATLLRGFSFVIHLVTQVFYIQYPLVSPLSLPLILFLTKRIRLFCQQIIHSSP